jgi:hypothetical protein
VNGRRPKWYQALYSRNVKNVEQSLEYPEEMLTGYKWHPLFKAVLLFDCVTTLKDTRTGDRVTKSYMWDNGRIILTNVMVAQCTKNKTYYHEVLAIDDQSIIGGYEICYDAQKNPLMANQNTLLTHGLGSREDNLME